MPLFINEVILSEISWQGFERLLNRLLILLNYSSVRLVGQSADGGADLIAHKQGKRWLFQAKKWESKVGLSTVDKTLSALVKYHADVPVIVASSGFDSKVIPQRLKLQRQGIPLQLWDQSKLLQLAQSISLDPGSQFVLRDYQAAAVRAIYDSFVDDHRRKGMVVLATGLGKTFVAAEAVRRISQGQPGLRVLVLAHTNDLVYQLERSFWPLLTPLQDTAVWNGLERPSRDRAQHASVIFGTIQSLALIDDIVDALGPLDLVIVDECHHAGSSTYSLLLERLEASKPNGPYLLGLTATPWRADSIDLIEIFGKPLIVVDLVTGLKRGFLTNVDYRMFTDNIDWENLRKLPNQQLSPKQVNRTLFIDQWDDAVVDALQSTWAEVMNPRAIVFCGTIDHAATMRDRINARRFAKAEAIFSTAFRGVKLSPVERNRILSDFSAQRLDIICAVDIFNEGIDVPDVNILVFQRVTHSRRIFIQQLGRGLRLSEGKSKVIVLDFVSDIRRFAAGIDLQRKLGSNDSAGALRIALPGVVSFRRLGAVDTESESFLKEWLADVAAIEDAGDDASVLKFPPLIRS